MYLLSSLISSFAPPLLPFPFFPPSSAMHYYLTASVEIRFAVLTCSSGFVPINTYFLSICGSFAPEKNAFFSLLRENSHSQQKEMIRKWKYSLL
jgi:hypothetical protein